MLSPISCFYSENGLKCTTASPGHWPVPIVLARTTTGYWPRSHLTPHVTRHVPAQPAVNSKEDTTFIGLGLHHVSKSSFIHTA